MIDAEIFEKFKDAVYKAGLIEKRPNSRENDFTAKANDIIADYILGGWSHFAYDNFSFCGNEVYYWLPVYYSDFSIFDSDCWSFIKQSDITNEMIEKFCKFFKMNFVITKLYEIEDDVFDDI